MSDLELAQSSLGRALGRARAGEDRELAQRVREAGEQLSHMLGGLLKPSEGRIAIGSNDLTALNEGRLPDIRLRHVGFIFQDFNLLSALTALDNVALVAQLAGLSRRAARKRAKELLDQLGLGHRLGFLPEKLSGGEKQRVAIARALVNRPDIILADEPTANLDSHHGRETLRLLRDIAKQEGRSVIIVSHDQRIRDIADRVLWLEDGQFKNTVDMALDPVCGMSVEIAAAPAWASYGDQVYYFCAQGCRDEFLADPMQFLDNSAHDRSPQAGSDKPLSVQRDHG